MPYQLSSDPKMFDLNDLEMPFLLKYVCILGLSTFFFLAFPNNITISASFMNAQQQNADRKMILA